MVNKIGTVYTCGSNKEFSLRFCVDSGVQLEAPEKHYENNNSPNILSNNNYQASSQKFRHIKCKHLFS